MRDNIKFYTKQGSIEHCLELLDMSEACLWLIDSNYKLLAFNRVYAEHMQLFAKTSPQIGSDDIVLTCFPADFSSHIAGMYKKALAGATLRFVEKGFNPDGSPADVVMVFKPLMDDDNTITGVCCMRNDISDLISIKNQLDNKREQIAQINWRESHLIRGPLATAMGITNLLLEESTDKIFSEGRSIEFLQALNEKLVELDKVVRSIVAESDGA